MTVALERLEIPMTKSRRGVVASDRRPWTFYALAILFGFFLLFLYGPMLVMYVLSFQGPNGGVTFPLVGTSLVWFEDILKPGPSIQTVTGSDKPNRAKKAQMTGDRHDQSSFSHHPRSTHRSRTHRPAGSVRAPAGRPLPLAGAIGFSLPADEKARQAARKRCGSSKSHGAQLGPSDPRRPRRYKLSDQRRYGSKKLRPRFETVLVEVVRRPPAAAEDEVPLEVRVLLERRAQLGVGHARAACSAPRASSSSGAASCSFSVTSEPSSR